MTTPSLIVQPPKNKEELNEIMELVKKISNMDKFIMTKADGESIELPQVISQVLYEIITILSQGGSMTIIPMDKELTTQQAADILNVSRPYFVKLLENDIIPYHKTGTHRKILMKDLIEYKNQISKKRKVKLSEMIDLSQGLGLYD